MATLSGACLSCLFLACGEKKQKRKEGKNRGQVCEKFRLLRPNATRVGGSGGNRCEPPDENVPTEPVTELGRNFPRLDRAKKKLNFHALVAFMIISLLAFLLCGAGRFRPRWPRHFLLRRRKIQEKIGHSVLCRHNNGGKYRSNFFTAPLLLHLPVVVVAVQVTGNTFSHSPEFPEKHAHTKTQRNSNSQNLTSGRTSNQHPPRSTHRELTREKKTPFRNRPVARRRRFFFEATAANEKWLLHWPAGCV